MKFTIAIAAAIASFCAGLARGAEAKTHHGMLKQCKDFSLEGLNGDKGRAMTLKATCRTVDSSLDLNTCFGYVSLSFSSFLVLPPSPLPRTHTHTLSMHLEPACLACLWCTASRMDRRRCCSGRID